MSQVQEIFAIADHHAQSFLAPEPGNTKYRLLMVDAKIVGNGGEDRPGFFLMSKEFAKSESYPAKRSQI